MLFRNSRLSAGDNWFIFTSLRCCTCRAPGETVKKASSVPFLLALQATEHRQQSHQSSFPNRLAPGSVSRLHLEQLYQDFAQEVPGKSNHMDWMALRKSLEVLPMVDSMVNMTGDKETTTFHREVARAQDGRREQRAVQSSPLVDGRLLRPRSRRLGGSRAGRWTRSSPKMKWLTRCTHISATSDGLQTRQHGIRARRRAVTDQRWTLCLVRLTP